GGGDEVVRRGEKNRVGARGSAPATPEYRARCRAPLRTMWSLRITLFKLRPFNLAAIIKLSVTAGIGAAFLYGDFKLFQRLFRAVADIEQTSPFFALGLLRNLIALVFLIAVVILFSSSMTAAIGAFFADLDLDTYHAAPMSKTRLVLTRWFKTFAQSATVIYIFIIPMFVAFALP